MSEKSEKLQKVLARAGHGSRREIETIISASRVSVDGKIAKLGDRVEVTQALKIRIDGHLISMKESVDQVCRVLAYYKPEGELCTRSDPEGRPTVFDRLPKLRGARWIAVGRLDVNTCGLLLFTTDGELANRLMHPSREVEREYAVRVFGEVDDDKIKQLSRGVQLEDGPAAFKTIKFTGGEGINQWYSVTLTEGRNREVRRLWEAVGVQVSRLIRVRYGDIKLPKGLPRGGYSELELAPTNYLRALVELDVETNSKVAVEKDRRPMKANQIRRAVKRHSQVSGDGSSGRTDESAGGRPSSRIGENAGGRSSGRTGENAGGRPSSRSGENAGGRSSGRTGENASGRPSSRSGENAGGRSSGRTGESAGGRPSDRTSENAGGRSSGRTGENAGGRSSDRTGENAGGRSSGRTGENAGGRSNGRTGENAGGRSNGRTGENAGGRSSGRTGENAGGRSSGRTGENAGGRSSGRTGENAGGRSSGRTGENAGGRPSGRSGKNSGGRSS